MIMKILFALIAKNLKTLISQTIHVSRVRELLYFFGFFLSSFVLGWWFLTMLSKSSQCLISWKGSISSIPATNPPMWANHATPPSPETTPLKTWINIQITRRMIAGTRIMVIKNPKKTNVFTRAKGNKIRYAPSIAEMAPLAPTIGISDWRSVKMWPIEAIVPQTR